MSLTLTVLKVLAGIACITLLGGCATPFTAQADVPTVHVHIGITAAGTMGDEEVSHGNEQKTDKKTERDIKTIDVISKGADILVNGKDTKKDTKKDKK
jgi:uncharacterized lipoprotein YajG